MGFLALIVVALIIGVAFSFPWAGIAAAAVLYWKSDDIIDWLDTREWNSNTELANRIATYGLCIFLVLPVAIPIISGKKSQTVAAAQTQQAQEPVKALTEPEARKLLVQNRKVIADCFEYANIAGSNLSQMKQMTDAALSIGEAGQSSVSDITSQFSYQIKASLKGAARTCPDASVVMQSVAPSYPEMDDLRLALDACVKAADEMTEMAKSDGTGLTWPDIEHGVASCPIDLDAAAAKRNIAFKII